MTAFRHWTLSLSLLGLLLAGLCAATAPAGAASSGRVELGAANMGRLTPNCGLDFSRDCYAEGKVTMFQAKSKGTSGRTFQVKKDGLLVSWSVALAAVTTKPVMVGNQTKVAQKPFFDSVFGTPSSARISVLRQLKVKSGAPKFQLVRHSPVEILNGYFGTTVTFALEKPLPVKKGQVVALTIPTWAPVLWRPRACNATDNGLLDPDACKAMFKDYAARTSRVPRGKDGCTLGWNSADDTPNEALAKSRPQMATGSERRYGCYYGPQVALYSATVVFPPKP